MLATFLFSSPELTAGERHLYGLLSEAVARMEEQKDRADRAEALATEYADKLNRCRAIKRWQPVITIGAATAGFLGGLAID